MGPAGLRTKCGGVTDFTFTFLARAETGLTDAVLVPRSADDGEPEVVCSQGAKDEVREDHEPERPGKDEGSAGDKP